MADAAIIPLDPNRRRGRRTPSRPAARPAARPSGVPLDAALESYLLSHAARGTSPNTWETYKRTITLFTVWLAEHSRPLDVEGVEVEDVRAFLATERERTSPVSAHQHWRCLRAFFTWLIEQGDRRGGHPVDKADEPKVAQALKHPLTDAELKALLRVCSGNDFEARRDTAIVRVLADNGMRVSGLVGIRYLPGTAEHDVFLSQYMLRIVLKGGSEHAAPIGRKAAAALDRYIRERARHRHADEPWLWIGTKGRLQKSGVQQMLARRGEQAGIERRVHPHMLRRTMADAYLAGGGDPLDLMRIGGWKSLNMVQHYTEARADQRAREAHARLSPGDRL